MISNDPFESCRLKLTRAKEHADTLKNEITPWYESDPYRFVKEYDTETRTHIATLELKDGKEPQLIRWSLLSADCIHNLRTALDHLAFAIAIVKSGQDPPPAEGAIQFPIADSPEQFSSGMKRYKLARYGDTVRAAFESVQPYNRPNRFPGVPSFTALIRDLENRDKHRLLMVAVSKPYRTTIDELSLDLNCTVTRWYFHDGPLKNRTKFLTFTTSQPTPDVKYKIDATIAIGIQYGPGRTDYTEVCGFNLELVDEVASIINNIISAIRS